MSDPLDILRTDRDATPGPWTSLHDVVLSSAAPVGWARNGAVAPGEAAAFHSEDDARHCAVWDPETTREVVAWVSNQRALLRLVLAIAEIPGAESEPGLAEHVRQQLELLDALLARVRERMGEP